MKKPQGYACTNYKFCGCSSSNDGHCQFCMHLPIDHDLEACIMWSTELKRREEIDNAII